MNIAFYTTPSITLLILALATTRAIHNSKKPPPITAAKGSQTILITTPK